MKRAEFIKSSVAFSMLSLLPINSIASVFNSTTEFPENELLGIDRPVLKGDGFSLREEAASAFEKMKEKAANEGIDIKVVSSYRSFSHQKRIWQRKYKRYIDQNSPPEVAISKIIAYSTIPGTSRHHWGTEIDIIDGNSKHPKHVLQPKNFYENGPYTRLKNWMDKNSEEFGFHLVYTNNKDRKGFKHEPWHFSYKPTSQQMLKEYLKLNIKEKLKDLNLIGSEHFSDTFIQKYIQENICSINPALLP